MNSIRVEHLDNGLTAILAPNRYLPHVFGAVAVRAGSKYDPPDHTGMAHYLEHMLFKGTQELGTIDYASERPYLDSIAFWYDRLPKATTPDVRRRILQTINRLSVQAARYAIPNELDRLLQLIGAQNINAFTHYDKIVYHNAFPSHQIERWLDIYAHRFSQPVFRLFQSELEVVYEEKNRMMDDYSFFIMEALFKNFFTKHPYRRPIIGETHHLKTPSINAMYRYFMQYYRPNNMALILVGDFDIDDTIDRIRRKFGCWQPAAVPPFPTYEEPPFEGRKVVKLRVSPFRMGIIAFRVAPHSHSDAPILKFIVRLLSNANNTGLLDRLVREGTLLAAYPIPLLLQDHGMMAFFFMPKLVGQWFRTAERHVLRQLDRIKTGDYPRELFESVRYELWREAQLKEESNADIALELVDAFIYGIPPQEYLQRNRIYDALQPEQVSAVARKYFGSDYLVIQSRKGTPSKEKLPKPPFEPIQQTARGAESAYARRYKQLPELPFAPQFIDFSEGMPQHTTDRYQLYHTLNPLNSVASLTFRWRIGKLHDRLLPYVVSYLSLVGSRRYVGQQLGFQLGTLGFGFQLSVTDNYTTLSLTGPDENLSDALPLIFDWLRYPEENPSKIDIIYKQAKASYQALLHDPADVARVLRDYVMYGKYSPYLRQLPLKEIKNLTVQTLLDKWHEVRRRPFEVHYVGKHSKPTIVQLIDSIFSDAKGEVSLPSMPFIERPLRIPSNDRIYYANREDAIQSHLYFYSVTSEFAPEDWVGLVLFGRYFGSDMSSLLFQELREFRSLAYAAGGSFHLPSLPDGPLAFQGYLGTQSDKTVEAIETVYHLIHHLPVDSKRLGEIIASERNALLMNMPSMRKRSFYILRWRRRGWTTDPSQQLWEKLSSSEAEVLHHQMLKAYHRYLQSRPIVFMGVIDPRRCSIDQLQEKLPIEVLNPQTLITT